MKHVIVCGGELEPEFAASFLAPFLEEREGCEVIAADRGLEVLCRIGVRPDILLGDMDSSDGDLVKKAGSEGIRTFTYPVKKDYSDTEAAIRYAVGEKSEGIFLLGAAGGRLDHFLANVQMLLIPLKKGIPAEIADPCNRIRLLDKAVTLRKDKAFGKYVSLIPLSTCITGLTMTGFAYPLKDYTLRKGGSLGISNEIKSKTARISFTKGCAVLIMSKDRDKK